ncbi:MAG: (2Fe-2S)-binding protein, partial [Ilumatobacteraceae bacterium]
MAENVTYTLKVNGTSYTVTADSGLPLLWLLRDVVGLTGTKYGCGITQCKACSVLVNGVLERSCDYDAKNAAGKNVVTVEGLSPDLTNKLQQAWITEQVPQCGYCQSGAHMAASNLL